MQMTKKHDKYWIDCGCATPYWTNRCRKWCWENWGPEWGDIDTKLDHTIFIFHREAHASWFMLKWAKIN